MTLSLVVPVYAAPDLARRLAGHLDGFRSVAASCGYELVETIFVDDGSPADSAVPPLDGVRVLRNDVNRGKGHSVRRAALESRGEFVLMSDVDESAPLGEFPRLAAAMAPGVGLVCGSRYLSGSEVRMPFRRKVLSRLFNLFLRACGVRGVCDTQCGFKLFRMSVFRAVFEAQRMERFAFDVELIRRARRVPGCAVVEVPVNWRGGERTSLHVFRDGFRMVFDVLFA